MRISCLSLSFSTFVLAAAAFTHADTIVQSFTAPDGSLSSNVINTSAINQFNPSFGSLDTVKIDFTIHVEGDNTNPPPIGTTSVTVLVQDSAGSVDALQTIFLGAGPFGFTVSPTSGASNLFGSDFLGTGQIALEAFADIIPSSNSGSYSDLVGAVTYNYTPTAATPEPSSFVLLGSGLLGFAGFVRRRFVDSWC